MRTATSTDFFFEQMGRFQLLDDATTMELANKVQAWQQHPNGPDFAPIQIRLHGNAARDKLVRHNLRLVVHIWKSSYQGRLSISNPGLIDALQTASMNLVRAAEKFTAKRGTLVKNIRVGDDPTHVEGRVNKMSIMLKTCFLKRVVS